MKNVILSLLLVGAMLFISGEIYAQEEESAIDLAAKVEVDIQLSKDYDVAVFDVNAELSSQSYLLALDIDFGKNLTLTPNIGIFNSTVEVADVIRLENEVGLAAGIGAEYRIVEIYNGIVLSLIGAYDYRHTEVDTIELIPAGITIDNPLRNDLTIQSWEVGPKVSFDILPLNVVPYVAVVYSDSRANLNTELAFLNLDVNAEATENMGLRLGLVGEPIKGWKVAVEGRLLDDQAVMFTARKTF